MSQTQFVMLNRTKIQYRIWQNKKLYLSRKKYGGVKKKKERKNVMLWIGDHMITYDKFNHTFFH